MELGYISTDAAPRAIGPYSQAVTLDELVFCAGQLPLDPSTGKLVGDSIALQAERVLDNIAAILNEAGAGLDTVARATVYLVDLRDLPAMNAVYAQRFGDHRPARATVQVAGIPTGARLAIECIAARRR